MFLLWANLFMMTRKQKVLLQSLKTTNNQNTQKGIPIRYSQGNAFTDSRDFDPPFLN